MQNENIEQLKKIAKVFNTQNVITAVEIEQVLVGIMQIMTSFKKDNESLTKETKKLVETLFDKVLEEREKLLQETKDTISTADTKLSGSVTAFLDKKGKEFDTKIDKVQAILTEIKSIEVKDGKDADEDRIIAEIIAQLKTEQPVELTGEQIVSKINLLELAEEYQIDAKHIKNLPSPKGGYSPTVLGNAVDLNQSARADGYAIVWDDINKNFKFAESGGGPVTGLTGNPTEYVYIDNTGNGTGDSLNTRDSATLETHILKSYGGDIVGGINLEATEQNLAMQDTVTGAVAGYFTTNSAGVLSADFGWNSGVGQGVGFVASQGGAYIESKDLAAQNSSILQLLSGVANTLTWDSDTTDLITAQIVQSDDIYGSGIKGTGIAYGDFTTPTNGNAFFVVGDIFSGLLGLQGTVLDPSGDSIGFDMNLNDGFFGSYVGVGAGLFGALRLQSSGNTMSWDFDTTDGITTTLTQNQDILGLGGLAGSALTWEDTTTQVQAFIGAVDASAVGLFPGSVLMVTNDNATGASANISTNYDNVLNVATAVANVANSNFDSGFEFDDGRMIVRYRNSTTGFESAFESDINGALTRYKLDTASDEYSTQLSDGVFQFFNSTTADQYMSLGASTGIYMFGDISGSLNSTVLAVNDTAETVYVTANSGLLVEATSGGNQWLNVAPAAGVVQLGDLSGGNGTLEVNSTGTGSINVTRPLKLQGYTQATLPTGVVGQTAYITDALTPVFGATAVGGGAVTVPVFFDGVTWIVG